jgi:hypothetical protein
MQRNPHKIKIRLPLMVGEASGCGIVALVVVLIVCVT